MDKFSEMSHADRIAYLASKVALAKSYDSPVLTVQIPDLEILLAELEAKDKRISELELDELAMRASSRAVHEAQENHINQQQDRIDSLEKTNAGLGRGLAAAEQKLATPVRLPTEHELHQVACSECAGNCLELVESTVRAAGFTVSEE